MHGDFRTYADAAIGAPEPPPERELIVPVLIEADARITIATDSADELHIYTHEYIEQTLAAAGIEPVQINVYPEGAR